MNFSYYSVFFHQKIKNRNFLKYKSTKFQKKFVLMMVLMFGVKLNTKILEKKLSYLLLKLEIDMAFFDFIKIYDMINK